MREIRLSGSEGGGAGYSTGPPYPYHRSQPVVHHLRPGGTAIGSPGFQSGVELASATMVREAATAASPRNNPPSRA
jgi:hypothetical protein